MDEPTPEEPTPEEPTPEQTPKPTPKPTPECSEDEAKGLFDSDASASPFYCRPDLDDVSPLSPLRVHTWPSRSLPGRFGSMGSEEAQKYTD